MKFLPAPSAPAKPMATFRGALSNLAKGLYHATARFANYHAASPTATTRVGSRIGSNLNSPYAAIQRAGMQWTSEDLQKNAPLAMAYLRVRANYCRPTRWKPSTGDSALNLAVSEYCEEKWRTMGFACSMQAAVARTLHIETPIRGDAGMILWRDESGDLRLIEFSADQVGEVYNYTPPRSCSLGYDADGNLCEVASPNGRNDCIYYSGRYFRGPDCVAYKIYQRTDSWYSNPRIYDARDVIYSVDPFNFRSMRGVTIFHNVMSCIEKGEALLQAGLSAAQRQAKTAFYVTNERGAPDDTSYQEDVGYDGRSTYFERIPGGPLVEYGYTGDTMAAVSPDSPGPELIAGVQEADQRFCIGLGMTYAFVISGEKLGGAISRLDANRSSGEIERLREDVSNPVLNRIAQVTIMDGVRKRELPAEKNIAKGHWSYVNLPTADAFRESMDDIKSVRAGQDSNTRVLARYAGATFEDIMHEKEDETFIAYQSLHNVNKRLKAAGVPLTASIADLMQVTDNPMQTAAAAEVIDKTGEAPKAPTDTAKMAAAHNVDDEARDEDGKWTSGGDSVSSSKKETNKNPNKGLSEKSKEIFRKEWGIDESELSDLEKNGRKSQPWKDYIDQDILDRKLPEVEELLKIHPKKQPKGYTEHEIHSAAERNGFMGPFFHGTDKNFDEVDSSKFGGTTLGPGSKSAFWVSEDRSHAAERGPIVKPFYIKPERVKKVSGLIDTFDAGKIVDEAKRSGEFDAVHFESLDDSDNDSKGRPTWAVISGRVESGDPNYKKSPVERFKKITTSKPA